ncbi:hypothetical protein NADRNF5_1860 [Nitrosopumilus adriaticus]|uniref:Uncharacterized protein n=1 Tax=Nitrosopumilus adriaticus TaxID=1580092 RepID=A0A0D5C4Q4_9ARCH|nr:hypothetical protein NADRNF5_1860 [Nitrosopumilus adriaticus]
MIDQSKQTIFYHQYTNIILYEKESGAPMMAVCTKCREKYEVSSSMEYLIKMGMVPESQRFCCEWCR